MSAPLYLGLDVGTQGVKALVYDPAAGKVIARGASPLDLLPIGRPGAAEQNPEDWLTGMGAAIQQALATPGLAAARIRAMAVSGQQHGFVALDGKGEVIRPAKLWCDTETAPEAAELGAIWGRPLPAGFTASKILWLKRHEAANFHALRHVLLPHDYCNYHLTGEMVAECGDASGTGLFRSEERGYDLDSAATIDPELPGMLPRLIAADCWVGEVRAEVAAELGLPAGVRVAPGSGDNMMSAIGAGAIDEGVLVVSLGTSGTLFGRSDTPVVDPQALIAPFCDALGGWLPLLCTMNCTTVVEEVRTAFDLDHATATAAATQLRPGCDGLLFLPYLAGERAPDWPYARGVIHGIEGGGLRPERLYRAALEGASFALKGGSVRLSELGFKVRELRVVGGGARNPLWRQILADLFAVPLSFPVEAESAALGAALQAMALDQGGSMREALRKTPPELEAVQILPDPMGVAAYAEAFERFQELAGKLFGSAVETSN